MSNKEFLQDLVPNDNEGLEALSVENVLSEIPLEFLEEIAKAKKIEVYVSSKFKKDRKKRHSTHVEELTKVCREVGIKNTVLDIPKFLMEVLTESWLDDEELKAKITEPKYNKETEQMEDHLKGAVVMRKRCYEKMIELSVRKYFEQYVTKTSDLVRIVKYFSRDPWTTSDNEMLLEQISEIFDDNCLTLFFTTNLSSKLLNDICDRMNLGIPIETNNVRYLTECIIFGTNATNDESEEEVEVDLSKKHPGKISDKCTRGDLVYYFTVEDLRDYLHDKNLLSSGRKVQLVNRIFEYFDDRQMAIDKYDIDKRKERRTEKTQKKQENREKRKRKMEDSKKVLSEKQSQDIDNKNVSQDDFEELEDEESDEKENRKKKNTKGRTSHKGRRNSQRKVDDVTSETENLKINEEDSIGKDL